MATEMVDLEKAVGYRFAPYTWTYSERDVLLYALAVGAGQNPVDEHELKYVYELRADQFAALPTFAVLFGTHVILQMTSIPGLRFHPMMAVHGEQQVELLDTLPTAATVTTEAVVQAVYDKGSGALVVIETETAHDGKPLARNAFSVFVKGLGGFGGERGPASGANSPPQRPPDMSVRETTRPEQALLYRLTGDRNPLHADPQMAALGGYPQPILHGLCTFGFAARALLRTLGGNDPARFKRMQARFSKHVFPGEVLLTDIWRDESAAGVETVYFQTRELERNDIVLSNGVLTLAAETA